MSKQFLNSLPIGLMMPKHLAVIFERRGCHGCTIFQDNAETIRDAEITDVLFWW